MEPFAFTNGRWYLVASLVNIGFVLVKVEAIVKCDPEVFKIANVLAGKSEVKGV